MKKLLIALALLLAASPAAAQKATVPHSAEEEGTYELRAVTVLPRPLNVLDLQRALEAGYPPELRAARIGAEVEVRLRLDPQGVPHDLEITRSTNAAFNEPTLNALRVLRFSPAEVEEQPVWVWIVLPILWTVGPEEGEAADLDKPAPTRRPAAKP